MEENTYNPLEDVTKNFMVLLLSEEIRYFSQPELAKFISDEKLTVEYAGHNIWWAYPGNDRRYAHEIYLR